jgi:hypothetical protein
MGTRRIGMSRFAQTQCHLEYLRTMTSSSDGCPPRAPYERECNARRCSMEELATWTGKQAGTASEEPAAQTVDVVKFAHGVSSI